MATGDVLPPFSTATHLVWAAWSQTSRTSAANSSPPWLRSRELDVHQWTRPCKAGAAGGRVTTEFTRAYPHSRGNVAVLYAPFRDRHQDDVNRLTCGECDELYAVRSCIALRLASGSGLASPSTAPDQIHPSIPRSLPPGHCSHERLGLVRPRVGGSSRAGRRWRPGSRAPWSL
jgi:hypothetical protein